MSYVTVSEGKLGGGALPANRHGHADSMRGKTTKQHSSYYFMFALAMAVLIAAVFDFKLRARAQDIHRLRVCRVKFNRSEIIQHTRVIQWKQSDC
jgi:hypothetical protein